MFHSAAAKIPANVVDEKILAEGRAAHHAGFVLHDAREHIRDARMVHRVAVNRYADRSSGGLKLEHVERADFDRCVHQRVVTWRVITLRAFGDGQLDRGPPALRDIGEMHHRFLGAAVRNVTEHHGQIQERVLAIKLRAEGAGLIPVIRVLDANLALALDGPRLLVGTRYAEWFSSSVDGVQAQHVIAEIADLIERAPRRDLHRNALAHFRDGHRDVELMLRRARQRDVVADRRAGRSHERE